MLYGALLPIQAIRFKLTLYLLFYVFYVLCMSHFIVCFYIRHVIQCCHTQ